MNRRSFFSGAAGLGTLPLFSSEARAQAKELKAQARSVNLKITAVELWQVTGDLKRYEAYLDEEFPKGGMIRPAPAPGAPPPVAPTRVYMKIVTDGGLEGFYGPHDPNVVSEVIKIASVVGMDPFAIDTVWESLVTGDNRYTGTYMFGVSAITNTLWDMKGKLCNLPVYRLLGGSRKVVDCYATTIGMPSNTLDVIAEGAARVKKAGFKAQKWFPLQGPRNAVETEALDYNVNMMKTLRRVCGEGYDIMIDALTRWDLPFSMKWCKAVEQYRPRFLEEPVQTYLQVGPLARLRQMTSIPIATGEHNYNRWEFQELMKADAVDILQPDTEWCGGISEVTKICAMASANGLKVMPHHMKLAALAHLVASQPVQVCPMIEYRHSMYSGHKYFERDPIGPNANGQIEMSDRPGLGIELDDAKIVSMKKIFPA